MRTTTARTCSPRSARSRCATTARPTPPRRTQYAEGKRLLAAWVADHDVEVNPKYAVDLDAADFDNAGQIDTDLSVAVGTKAKDGLKPAPDSAYTSSLPSHLVCLD